jgi:hypothetical protein
LSGAELKESPEARQLRLEQEAESEFGEELAHDLRERVATEQKRESKWFQKVPLLMRLLSVFGADSFFRVSEIDRLPLKRRD